MIPARQSTALETAIGPVLDADGVAVTGCVVGDFKIKKTTGNFAALNGSATLTHVSAGVYDLVLTTSDTDTVGLCCIAIDDTVNACASIYLQVMEEATYDDLYAASAVGYLKPTTAGRTLDVSAGGEAGVDWANVGSPTTSLALTGTTIATTQKVDLDTIKTQTVTCGAGVTVLASVGTAATSTAQTGDTYALANGSAGFVAIDTVVDAIKVKTDSLTFTVANTLNAAVTHWVATAVATPTVAGVPEVDVTHLDGSATNLDALSNLAAEYESNGYVAADVIVASVGVIADAVWDEAGAGHVTSGTFGARLDALISSRSSHSATDVWAAGTRTLTAGTNIQLPSNGLANVTAWTVNITGTLSGTVGGIAGTITTLDALDTAQDTQHGTTQTAVSGVPTALLDLAAGVETGLTLRQAMRLLAAASAGKLSGAATTTIVIRNAVADSKDRITATVDASGNRSAITVDLT